MFLSVGSTHQISFIFLKKMSGRRINRQNKEQGSIDEPIIKRHDLAPSDPPCHWMQFIDAARRDRLYNSCFP